MAITPITAVQDIIDDRASTGTDTIPAPRRTMDLDGSIRATDGFFIENNFGIESRAGLLDDGTTATADGLDIFNDKVNIFLASEGNGGVGIGTLDPRDRALFIDGDLQVADGSFFSDTDTTGKTVTKDLKARCDVQIGIPEFLLTDGTTPDTDHDAAFLPQSSTLKVFGKSDFEHQVLIKPSTFAGVTIPTTEFLLKVEGSTNILGESILDNKVTISDSTSAIPTAEFLLNVNGNMKVDTSVDIGIANTVATTDPSTLDGSLNVFGFSNLNNRVAISPTGTDGDGTTWGGSATEFLLTVNGPTNITGDLTVGGNINGDLKPDTLIIPFSDGAPTAATPGEHGQMMFTRAAIYIFTPRALAAGETAITDIPVAEGQWERVAMNPINDAE